MVCRLSRIRGSSGTRILPPRTSVGTLKSTRTSTRFPRTPRSRTETLASLYSCSCARSVSQHFHQLHAAIAVAPFVIIPADHFYEPVTAHQCQLAVQNAGVRIANDVLRNERLLAEFADAFVAFILRCLLERSIDCVHGRVLLQHGCEIRHRTIRRRHPERAPI